MGLSVAVGGCLDDLPDPKLIEGLRVIGVKATPPEVSAGETVTLEALVVDAEDREVTIEWAACLLPERAFGFFAGSASAGFSGGKGYGLQEAGDCFELLETAPEQVYGTGTGNEMTFTVPLNLLSDPQSVAQLLGLAADAEVPPEAIAIFLTVAGINLNVSLRVTAGEDQVDAYKRVNVSLATPKNLNPSNLAFHLAPVDDDVEAPKTGPPPGGRKCFLGEESGPLTIKRANYRITPVNIPDPPLEYPVLVGGTTTDQAFGVEVKEEVLFYSFFTREGGNFERRVVKSVGSGFNDWLLDDEDDAPGPEAPIWIVVRDGRGGLEWCHSVVTLSD